MAAKVRGWRSPSALSMREACVRRQRKSLRYAFVCANGFFFLNCWCVNYPLPPSTYPPVPSGDQFPPLPLDGRIVSHPLAGWNRGERVSWRVRRQQTLVWLCFKFQKSVALTPYEAKGWTSPLIGCVTATCSNGSFLSFVLLCSSSSVISKQRGRLYCSTEGDQTLKKTSERKQVCVTNCFMSPVFPFQISRKSSAELLFDPIVHSTPNLQSGESLNVSPDWTVKAPFRSETDTSQILTKPAVLQWPAHGCCQVSYRANASSAPTGPHWYCTVHKAQWWTRIQSLKTPNTGQIRSEVEAPKFQSDRPQLDVGQELKTESCKWTTALNSLQK